MSVSHNIGYGSHYQKDSEAVEALSGHYNTSLVLNEIRIPLDYDFTKSTSDNYKWKGNGNPPFVGKYAALRHRMDYNYHPHYAAERQYVQDVLIDESYHSVIRDSVTAVECEKLEENWLVFTAGTMVSIYLYVY